MKRRALVTTFSAAAFTAALATTGIAQSTSPRTPSTTQTPRGSGTSGTPAGQSSTPLAPCDPTAPGTTTGAIVNPAGTTTRNSTTARNETGTTTGQRNGTTTNGSSSTS